MGDGFPDAEFLAGTGFAAGFTAFAFGLGGFAAGFADFALAFFAGTTLAAADRVGAPLADTGGFFVAAFGFDFAVSVASFTPTFETVFVAPPLGAVADFAGAGLTAEFFAAGFFAAGFAAAAFACPFAAGFTALLGFATAGTATFGVGLPLFFEDPFWGAFSLTGDFRAGSGFAMVLPW